MDDSITAIRQPIRSNPRVILNPHRPYGRTRFVCHASWTAVRGIGETHQAATESFVRHEGFTSTPRINR